MPRTLKDNAPAALRMEVMIRDGFVCHYCGSKKRLVVDHKTPVCKGGPTEAENLVASCRSCNSRKGSSSYEEFTRKGENCAARKPVKFAITTGHPASRYGFPVILADGALIETVAGIKAVRESLELSRCELAWLCNASPRTVEKWEQGRDPVPANALNVLAGLLRKSARPPRDGP